MFTVKLTPNNASKSWKKKLCHLYYGKLIYSIGPWHFRALRWDPSSVGSLQRWQLHSKYQLSLKVLLRSLK